jgi:hypothetical protein
VRVDEEAGIGWLKKAVQHGDREAAAALPQFEQMRRARNVCTERIMIFLHYSALSVVFSFTHGIRGSLKLTGTQNNVFFTKG